MNKQECLFRHNREDYSKILKQIWKENPFLKEEESLYIYSKEILNNRLQHLRSVYPQNALHAVAIKANSIPEVLQHIVSQGHGLEAASIEEVRLAVEAGCDFGNIVFDSPAKTRSEIKECNDKYPNILINANCFAELERLRIAHHVRVGIRINPLMDVESPSIFAVSNANSKFGIPISLKKRIIEYAIKIPNVSALHIHAGSEIGNPQKHINAIGRIFDIAEEINTIQPKKITTLDIGGGFPALMEDGEQSRLDTFVALLQERCQGILEKYNLVTEYGRFVHAHAAFAVSRIEYVLEEYNPNIMIVHFGADMMPREIYSSAAPYHAKHILDNQGEIKPSEYRNYDIGGPLCFSGDFLNRNIQLPQVDEGDCLVVADCGANTMSMWSQHCSREKTKIWVR